MTWNNAQFNVSKFYLIPGGQSIVRECPVSIRLFFGPVDRDPP